MCICPATTFASGKLCESNFVLIFEENLLARVACAGSVSLVNEVDEDPAVLSSLGGMDSRMVSDSLQDF